VVPVCCAGVEKMVFKVADTAIVTMEGGGPGGRAPGGGSGGEAPLKLMVF